MRACAEALRALVAGSVLLAPTVSGQGLAELRVGHWVEIKGELGAAGIFEASAIEVLPPAARQIVIATASDVDTSGGRFRLLSLTVEVPDRVRWDDDLSLARLDGRRIELEGHYLGGGRFEAREIAARGAGRERITGRLDVLRVQEDGVEGEVMGLRVHLPSGLELTSTVPLPQIPLAAPTPLVPLTQARDDEDFVPGTIRLGPGLTFGALLEAKFTHEDGYDLDDERDRDVEKTRLTFRPQFLWTPSPAFAGLFSPRLEWNYRDAQERPDGWESDARIKELWGYLRDLAGSGVDLQIGRQTFDDRREWIYKHDLDAVRAIWRGYGLRVEASASTILGEESDAFDREATNLMLYVSNDDPDRHLAGWIVDRRASGEQDSYPIHFGARVLGEWLPDLELWAEGSLLRGYERDTNLHGYGFDVGGTYEPSFLKPFYFSAGFAFGSGDDASSATVDESYRQTGFQRNNGKLGGVTSFRYYGEVIDPELSNLAVFTLGVGARITRNASVDLVYHQYRQDVAAGFLLAGDLDDDPDGIHRDLGRGLDLVLGLRGWQGSDFEVVAGHFAPGDAFPGADDAWKLALQWRFRF